MSADLAELLQLARADEPGALERLLVACQDRLAGRIERKLPASIRSTVSVEDVLQEVYLEIFQNIQSVRSQELAGFLRWLLTLTDNRLIDCIRAYQAAKRGGGWEPLDPQANSSVDALLDLLWATSRTPSRSAARHENAKLLGDALEQLKPDYGEAIRLRYLEGLSVGEAAARMKRTEFAVHKLCSRGLARLRVTLGEADRMLSQS